MQKKYSWNKQYKFKQNKPKTNSKWARFVASFIIFDIVIAVGLLLFYQNLLNAPLFTEDTRISIKKGQSMTLVSKQIKDPLQKLAFGVYGKISGLEKQIKTGVFAITAGSTIPETYNFLITSQPVDIFVTIPEGSTTYQIDEILASTELTVAGEFNNAVQSFSDWDQYEFLSFTDQGSLIYPLEGYLFPDTYFVSPSSFKTEVFIQKMLDNFEQKSSSLNINIDKSLTDIVNVAAMIEEEANRDKDRAIISGIIWKRLNENWFLGIDATLLYLSTDREITYQDLQAETPYNTRNSMGLPPGPITNPGLASLKAAANPLESEYYFYLTSRDGDMIYGQNDAEHNSNKAKYL